MTEEQCKHNCYTVDYDTFIQSIKKYEVFDYAHQKCVKYTDHSMIHAPNMVEFYIVSNDFDTGAVNVFQFKYTDLSCDDEFERSEDELGGFMHGGHYTGVVVFYNKKNITGKHFCEQNDYYNNNQHKTCLDKFMYI